MNQTDDEPTKTKPDKTQVTFMVLTDGYYTRHYSEEEAIKEATRQIDRGDSSEFVICRCTPIKRVRRPSVVIEKL